MSKQKGSAGKTSQYFRRGTLEIVGIPNSVIKIVLEEIVCGIIKKIGVEIDEQDVQVCNCLKENEIIMVNFFNRKDCLQMLRMKKELKSLDPTELDFPENTKIFCPYYRGIWSKCKTLIAIQKIHQFYTINRLIRVRLEEAGPSKIITHMADLRELLPDIYIEIL